MPVRKSINYIEYEGGEDPAAAEVQKMVSDFDDVPPLILDFLFYRNKAAKTPCLKI